jgi:hypothetical protein
MDDKDQNVHFFTALTTEHFVMQTAIGATLSEAQSRASMFLGILTGSLIAMGLATRSPEVLMPFIATVFPAVFVMGAITVLRLTDISMESSMAQIAIARVRHRYRKLGPDAAAFFDVRLGRWPETMDTNPAMQLGNFVAYWTSAAAMVAAIDALVGAATVALLLKSAADASLATSLIAGAIFAAAGLAAFFYYQKWRFAELDRLAKLTHAGPV